MFRYAFVMIFPRSLLFYPIYDHFNFCPVNSLSSRAIIISEFSICFLATGASSPAALRLKYDLKSVFDAIFTEKKNGDRNRFEKSYLHF